MLSKATVISMKKKRADHSCGKGILLRASGYATNASPGPVRKLSKISFYDKYKTVTNGLVNAFDKCLGMID